MKGLGDSGLPGGADRRTVINYIVAGLLIAALIAQVLPPVFLKSGVCDEHGAHIPSGYVYLQSGIFSGGIYNPPLMQLLVAAPLVLGGIDYTPFSDRGLWAARLPVLVLSIALGLAVFAWAGSLYGRAAAPAALFLFCFEPNVIAHSGLATLDLGVSAFLFLAFFFLWKAKGNGNHFWWILACVAMTLALLSKFTAALLLPVFLALLVVGRWGGGPPAHRLRGVLISLVFMCLCVVALSHLLYHPPARGESGIGGSETVADPDLPGGTDLTVADQGQEKAADLDGRHPRNGPAQAMERMAEYLLPDLYVEGSLGKLRHTAGGHFAYLAGRRSMEGWWYYFPLALALKTPIPLLAAFLLSLAMGAGLRGRRADALFLLLPLVVYIAAMAWTGVNIGVRHVLLFYPFAAVAASAVLSRGLPRSRLALVALVLGAAWHAGGTLRISPHYLAYFNEAAGGPRGGPRYLIDSNIDWGQDDGLLAEFISEHPEEVLVNPGAFSPSVGTIAVNVNALKGIFRGDDTAYKWLAPFEPSLVLGFTWYVYEIECADYIRAAQESPADPDRKVWLASALRKSGRTDEALMLNREIAEDFPGRRGNVMYTSGRWLFDDGEYAEAEIMLRAAAEAGAGTNAREASRAAGIQAKRRAAQANAAELRELGEFYARNDDMDNAREALEEGVALAPEDAGLRLTTALLSAREGDLAVAEEQASIALDLDPGLERAHQLIHWSRQMAVAVGEIGSYEVQMECGRFDYRFGRPAQAARHYWTAFTIDPSSQAALVAMGEIIVRAKLGLLDLETPLEGRRRR